MIFNDSEKKNKQWTFFEISIKETSFINKAIFDKRRFFDDKYINWSKKIDFKIKVCLIWMLRMFKGCIDLVVYFILVSWPENKSSQT